MRQFIHTLTILLSCNIFYAQQQDLESLNKKDLIVLISKKDQEINKLTRQITSLNAEIQKDKKQGEQVVKEKEDFKNLLTETTNRWLKEVFIDKYITNKTYFQESNLPENNDGLEELKKNFEQYDIIIRSVIASNPSKEHYTVAERALDFNENYLSLLRIREEILPLKYREDVVMSTLQEMDSLPKLQGGKLQDTKNEIIGLLKNYKDRNCLLKEELSKFTKVDPDVAKPRYKGFENDPRFKDYPYFITVLQDIQKNINLYTPDSLPCDIVAVPTSFETLENSESKDTKEELLNKENNNEIIDKNKPESIPATIDNN